MAAKYVRALPYLSVYYLCSHHLFADSNCIDFFSYILFVLVFIAKHFLWLNLYFFNLHTIGLVQSSVAAKFGKYLVYLAQNTFFSNRSNISSSWSGLLFDVGCDTSTIQPSLPQPPKLNLHGEDVNVLFSHQTRQIWDFLSMSRKDGTHYRILGSDWKTSASPHPWLRDKNF